jgi:hypothetical protein
LSARITVSPPKSNQRLWKSESRYGCRELSTKAFSEFRRWEASKGRLEIAVVVDYRLKGYHTGARLWVRSYTISILVPRFRKSVNKHVELTGMLLILGSSPS